MTATDDARRAAVVAGDRSPTAGWCAPNIEVRGAAMSAWHSPDRFSLWLVKGTLDTGTTLRWGREHGDEVCFVARGALQVGDQLCREGETLTVEAGVAAEVTALAQSELLHFGSADPTPPRDGHYGPASTTGHGVHITGAVGIGALVREDRETRFLLDSGCETCRPTLLSVRAGSAWESVPHSHSKDELVHVMHGVLRMGAYVAEAGDTMAVPADLRYRLRSDGAFWFLNYRNDVAFQNVGRDKELILESSVLNGFEPSGTFRRSLLAR